MEVSHAARVKAFVEFVTETGESGRGHEEEYEAPDDSLQDGPPSGAWERSGDHGAGGQHTFKFHARIWGWRVAG
jgi:hypothetical protein